MGIPHKILSEDTYNLSSGNILHKDKVLAPKYHNFLIWISPQEIDQDFGLKNFFSYQLLFINLKTKWFHQMNNTIYTLLCFWSIANTSRLDM